MPAPIDGQTKNRIIEMYKNGKSLLDISREVNRPKKTISNMIYRLGLAKNSGSSVPVMEKLKDKLNDIKEMWGNGKTQEEISNKLGESRRTIMKVCKELGLKRDNSEAQLLKPKRDVLKEEKVIELYKNGHTLHQIADSIEDMSASQAHRIVMKNNVKKMHKHLNKSLICNDYEKGDPFHVIAKRYDISTYIVKQVLEEFGIKIRNPITKGGRKSILKNIELPPFEDTKEWFQNAYIKYGMQSIAKYLDRSIGYVSHKLRKYGIERFTISDRNLEFDYREIAESYKLLGSMSKVASRFQCTIDTVHRALDEVGIEPTSISEMFSGEGNPFHGKTHPEDVKMLCKEIGSYYGKKFWTDNPEYIDVVKEKQKELWSDIEKRREQSLKISKLCKDGKCGSHKGKISTRFGDFQVDSSYEAMLLEELENDERVVLVERDFDLISYEHNGSIHYYNPDFRIWLQNGEFFVVETKSKYLLARDKEKAKISAGFGKLMNKFMVASNESKRVDLSKVFDRIDLLTKPVDFTFDDLEIKECGEMEYLPFYSAFHYLGNSVRRGFTIGAYYMDKLVACCSFGPVVRKEVAEKQGVNPSEIMELTRFCIHPDYHKKNFASWMISKVVKELKLRNNIKKLVSFADQDQGHVGTIYKACGWILDGQTNYSYHYENSGGEFLHKKTLYERAKREGLREREYAVKYGWNKVSERPKNRYVMKIE